MTQLGALRHQLEGLIGIQAPLALPAGMLLPSGGVESIPSTHKGAEGPSRIPAPPVKRRRVLFAPDSDIDDDWGSAE